MANVLFSDKILVLIVEDEPRIQMFSADMIEDAGFQVLLADNADTAVRILESRSDVRIVFTDIDMPGSMDGLKLAAAVRGRWPPIDIIVTSGHRAVNLNELPERSVFIPKPYDAEQVVGMLRRLAV